jgi:NitT/TauT family transport system permease protein
MPSKIISLFIENLSSNELLIHTLVSTFEVLLGLVIGTILGILIAILLFEIPILAKIFDPYMVVLNALPKTALAPILIIWVGTNIKGIVIVSISISLIITIINALNAFNNVEEEKIKLLKTFGATKIQTLKYLILPANSNELLNIIRINIGMSWIGVIVGEFIVSKRGLGYLITYGTQIFRLDIVMMGVVTLAIVTMLMYKTLNLIAKKIKKNKGN